MSSNADHHSRHPEYKPALGRRASSVVTTVDHKRLGILYILSLCCFSRIGGVEPSSFAFS